MPKTCMFCNTIEQLLCYCFGRWLVVFSTIIPLPLLICSSSSPEKHTTSILLLITQVSENTSACAGLTSWFHSDNTIVSCSHDSANVQQRSLALPALFSEICKGTWLAQSTHAYIQKHPIHLAWCSSYGQTLPSLPFELCSPSASLADLQRQITSGSTVSEAVKLVRLTQCCCVVTCTVDVCS